MRLKTFNNLFKNDKATNKNCSPMATTFINRNEIQDMHHLETFSTTKTADPTLDWHTQLSFDKHAFRQNSKPSITPRLGSFGLAQIESLRIILNHVSEAIFLMDSHGLIQMMNPYGEQLFGIDREYLIGQPLTSFFAQPFASEYTQLLKEWSDTFLGESTFSHGPREVLIERRDGSITEVDISLSSIPVDECLYLGIMHDLSAHKKENQKLRRLARTDYLTQLANRRAFDEVLQRQWLECKAHNLPLSVVLIDIDHFKAFNDENGHLQGDLCLRQIAQTIAATLPSRMLAARYGGEEFAVILPGCQLNQASEIAQRIRESVNALSFTNGDANAVRKLTISQGLACSDNKNIKSIAGLINIADVALYRAKLNGRDNIMHETYS